MKKYPYIIVAILIIVAMVIIGFSTKSSPNDEKISQNFLTPTLSPTVDVSKAILGEEAQEVPNISSATISTTKGDIVIKLFPEAAPNTVANFAAKSKSGFYNNLSFHRVEDWVIQGGDPLGNGTGGGKMATELNNNPFIRGSVGVARGANVELSNDSQFFITKTDAPWLDKQYTNFGQVSSGLEVVDQIEIGDKILSVSIK